MTCKFCKIGECNRNLMWRICGRLSRTDLKRLLVLKKLGTLFQYQRR